MSELVELDRIRLDGDTQRRLVDPAVVQDYRERMEAGDKFPPADVFYDGTNHWLADGRHRYHAAKRAGLKSLDCNVHEGDVRQAQWFSLGANKTNGAHRDRCEVRRILETVLRDEEWAKTPAAKVAEHVGCSQQTVT